MIIIPKLLLKTKTFVVFDEYVVYIISMLTSNINFPILSPPLMVVQALSDAYHTAVVAAINGTRVQRQTRNQLRRDLHIMVTDLAWDVTALSVNDLAIYLTSGFDYKRPATPSPLPGVPQNYIMYNGKNSGELVSKHKKVDFAVIYVIEVGTTATPPEALPGTNPGIPSPTPGPIPGNDWWIAGASTASTYTITGLTRKVEYFSRCRAIGKGGKGGPWSNVASMICK